MNSKTSQDGYFYFKNGKKDLIPNEQEDFLGFEETEDSTTENQCEVIKPESLASTTKEHHFSLLMSAIDSFTPSDHSLSGEESEEELIHAVCASTPKPASSEHMECFSIPGDDFVNENWAEWSLSEISMPSPKVAPSQTGDYVGDIHQGGPGSPCEIPDAEMDSDAAQEGDSESRDDTNAFQQSNEVPNKPPYPPKEPEVEHPLHLFHNDQIVLQAISIWGINETPERTSQEDIAFNGIDLAGHLLEAAAAQMELKMIVNEASLMALANGLQLSIERGTGRDNPMIVRRGIGPMVADVLLDSQTGAVMGFAVGQLVPHPIVNSFGGVQGSVIHQVTRGYAIDDNARHNITEGIVNILKLSYDL